MNYINELFYELIQVAIGNRGCLSRTPSAQEWQTLYDMALKQSLLGVCFAGVQKLSSASYDNENENLSDSSNRSNLSELLYLKWMGMAAKIQQRNEVVNKQCIELVESLKLRGYRSCILKGQGIAALYKLRDESLELRDECLELREAAVDAKRNSQLSAINSQLGMLRQSGDIDVYVDCGRVNAIEYARSIQNEVDWDYKHLHLKVFKDTEVEVHYRPEVLMNLRKNRRLQRWFEEPEVQSSMFQVLGDLVAPLVEFNVFYILLHIYRHFLFEGVGLRQLMDYYFVLRAANKEGFKVSGVQEFQELLRTFGMMRFARGVMWIMEYVFDGRESLNPKPSFLNLLGIMPDEKEGRYILREVMEGGNFGSHDERIAVNVSGKKGSVLRILRHNWHLLAHYPSEALWAPVYFVWHFIWKKVRA